MKFWKSALLAATAMTATSAAADTMIYATDLPPTHFISQRAVEPMMKCMTEGTDCAIDFNYMPSGQLVKRNEMVDACGCEVEISFAQWVDENESKIGEEFATNGAVIYDVSDETLAEFKAALGK